MIRTYSELIGFDTLEGRFNYLKLGDRVGSETFGFDRYLNQIFYTNQEWKSIRNEVILRDRGFELGLNDYEISGPIYVHHMNPITVTDIEERSKFLLDPEYLISMSFNMHNALHYGDVNHLRKYQLIERTANDTQLW